MRVNPDYRTLTDASTPRVARRTLVSGWAASGSLAGTTSRLNAAHIQRPATCPEAFDRVLSSGIAGPRGRPPYRGTVVKPWLRLCLLYTSPSPRDGLLSRM